MGRRCNQVLVRSLSVPSNISPPPTARRGRLLGVIGGLSAPDNSASFCAQARRGATARASTRASTRRPIEEIRGAAGSSAPVVFFFQTVSRKR